MSVFEKIEKQQKGKEGTAPWMVGEQLKDICHREPMAAELVDKDLDVKEMSLAACERKIKEYADKHKKGSCAVVPPNVAEDIIREFYGIPKATDTSSAIRAPSHREEGVEDRAGSAGEIIDFASFL